MQSDFTLATELTEQGVAGERRISWPGPVTTRAQQSPQNPTLRGEQAMGSGGWGLVLAVLVFWALWWMFPGPPPSPAPAATSPGPAVAARATGAATKPSPPPSSAANPKGASQPARPVARTPAPAGATTSATQGPVASAASTPPGPAQVRATDPDAETSRAPDRAKPTKAVGTPPAAPEAVQQERLEQAPPVDLLRSWQGRM